MRIALDDNCRDMGNELKKLGYTVVDYKYRGKVEAVLYHSHYQTGILESINNTSMICSTNTTGVLLIDIKNKNIKDIDAVLKKRLYTPLF